MLIIGTDEAGYGPNLGPLVISATVWESAAEDLSFLFEPLKKAGIIIGDSKKIYHGGNTLETLETAVLSVLQFLGNRPAPLLADENKIKELADVFGNVLYQNGVRLIDVQSCIIEPLKFNQLLEHYGSKGTLLSNETMRLADKVSEGFRPALPRLYLCDKHGGRNHYLDLLMQFFPGVFIQPVLESREKSVYRFQGSEFRFIAKGEAQLPVALASMVSKYRREVAMKAFNDFWQTHVPNLQPTAGYPEDAKRFIKDIAAAKETLKISDETLWRKK